MIPLSIDGKDYDCPNSYNDITLGKFKQIQTWLDLEHNQPKVEKLIEGKVEDEEEALNFYLDFINYVTKIPKKLLMEVKPYGDSTVNELSIQWVFETRSFLLCVPQIEEPQPVERINNYYFIDKIDLNNAILKDLKFIEYQEAKAVQKAFNNLKDGAVRFEYLNLLLAIMYRPKEVKGKLWWKKEVIQQYDSETVRERAKEFDNIKMNVVWDCLFFFIQLKTNSLKSIEESFQKQVEAVKAT